MSDLLDFAIEAHGGWKRWQEIKGISAQAAIGGGLWHLKGWPDALAKTHVSIDPHHPIAKYVRFGGDDRSSLFESDRVALFSGDGNMIEERAAPREAFKHHTLTTPWDALDLAYFSGYAMWNYLTAPFLFKMPGFQSKEIEPWNEGSETWRRLHVTFPGEIPAHSREQTFYFDETGLLRRNDYSVDIIGGTSSANYALEPKTFGGIVFPTKRRVYAKDSDNKPLLDRIAVAIDLQSIDVS